MCAELHAFQEVRFSIESNVILTVQILEIVLYLLLTAAAMNVNQVLHQRLPLRPMQSSFTSRATAERALGNKDPWHPDWEGSGAGPAHPAVYVSCLFVFFAIRFKS